jgi:hypothetical protein
MYKLYNYMGEQMPCIPKEDGGMYFICSKESSDYQAYLKWLEEGNTPEPADEVNNG